MCLIFSISFLTINKNVERDEQNGRKKEKGYGQWEIQFN
jgi:hypothetical protein